MPLLEFNFGVYEGEVCPETGKRHGRGTLRYNTGNTYEGEWVQGAAHGRGTKHHANGDVYVGEWRGGKRAGNGQYVHAAGHIYEGQYADDVCSGVGLFRTATGDTYEGEWRRGVKHGQGIEVLQADGRIFRGTWRNGRKHGLGQLSEDGTIIVQGEWADGKPPAAPQPRANANANSDDARPFSDDQVAEMARYDPGTAAVMDQFSSNIERTMGALTGTMTGMERQLDALNRVMAQLDVPEDDAVQDELAAIEASGERIGSGQDELEAIEATPALPAASRDGFDDELAAIEATRK